MDEDTYISDIEKRIESLFGLKFVASQRAQLLGNIQMVSGLLGHGTQLQEVSRWLIEGNLSMQARDLLARHLTVGESYFFREKTVLNHIRKDIIPLLIAENRSPFNRVRIWSAGCSSGEEPYTIAMMLYEQMAELSGLQVSIVGSDINSKALDKARVGIYTPWSLRDTPDYFKEKYFIKTGKQFEIIPQIKNMVDFKQLNLADARSFLTDDAIRDVDLLLCRNVLMYMSVAKIKEIAGLFWNSLRVGGWFVTSQVELNDELFGIFERVSTKEGIVYRRGSVPKNYLVIKPNPAEYIGRAGQAFGSLPATRRANNGNINAGNNSKAKKKSETKTNTATKFVSEPVTEASAINRRKLLIDRVIILYENGNYEQCINLCKSIFREAGHLVGIALILARCYANLGRLNEAEAVVEKLIREEDVSAEIFYLYGIILSESNQYEKADQSLVKALYLEPDHMPARFQRSRVLMQLGKILLAKKELSNLMQMIKEFNDEMVVDGFEGMTAGSVREMVMLALKNYEDG